MRKSYNPMKADVWAVGVVFYILFHGAFPFLAKNDDLLKKMIGNGEYRLNHKLDP